MGSRKGTAWGMKKLVYSSANEKYLTKVLTPWTGRTKMRSTRSQRARLNRRQHTEDFILGLERTIIVKMFPTIPSRAMSVTPIPTTINSNVLSSSSNSKNRNLSSLSLLLLLSAPVADAAAAAAAAAGKADACSKILLPFSTAASSTTDETFSGSNRLDDMLSLLLSPWNNLFARTADKLFPMIYYFHAICYVNFTFTWWYWWWSTKW